MSDKSQEHFDEPVKIPREEPGDSIAGGGLVGEEREVTVKNLTIHYTVLGQGKPFLMLHGWGSNASRWEKIAQLLAPYGLQLIIPDLPGFGKSQEPKTSWSLDNYVEWLLEFVATVPELQHGFYLGGHSFGGALAAKFTIKYNQHVQKLFLISSACVRKRTTLKKVWYRLAKMTKVFSFIPGYTLGRKAFYKFILRKSDYPYVSGIMKETYLRVILDDLSHKINFIKVPTFVIWGNKDESTPLLHGEFIRQRIPNSTLDVILGADHSLHIKMPEALAEKIVSHL